MDPLRGRLVLRGVAAAVPGARPFLTADEAEVEIDVREGLRRSLHVRHVAAEGVRIDLSAPLPASQGTSTGELTFLSAARIDHIRIEISSVVSGPLPASLREVALGARIEKARLTGNLHGGTLSLQGSLPSVVVDRPGPLRLTAAGNVVLSLTEAGQLTLTALHLAGDGFTASAWGGAGLSPEAPIALHAEVSAEPAKVAPELGTTGTLRLVADLGGSRSALSATLAVDGQDVKTPDVALETVTVKARLKDGTLFVEAARADLQPGGRVEGEGRFDLGAGAGTWTLRAARLPDGLLAGIADEATRARWGIAGTELDGIATVRHGRGDPLPLTVDTELSLSRAGTSLATATARLESRGATTLDLAATFLPDSPGERRAEGSLRAPTLAGLASGRLTDGRLRVRAPDLAEAYAELRALFPSLVVAAPEGVDLGGGLRLDVEAAGPLRALRVDVDGDVRPGAGGLALAPRGRRRRPPPGRRDRLGSRPFDRHRPSRRDRARIGRRHVRPGSETAVRPRHSRRSRPLPRRGAAAPRNAPRHARGRGPGAADRRSRRHQPGGPGSGAGPRPRRGHGPPLPDGALPRRRPRRRRLRGGALGRGARPPARRRPRARHSACRPAGSRGGPRRAPPARCAARRSRRGPPPPAGPSRGTARADARRAGLRLLRSRGVPSGGHRRRPRFRQPPRLRDDPPRRSVRRHRDGRARRRVHGDARGPARRFPHGARHARGRPARSRAGHRRRGADVVSRLRFGRPRARRTPGRGPRRPLLARRRDGRRPGRRGAPHPVPRGGNGLGRDRARRPRGGTARRAGGARLPRRQGLTLLVAAGLADRDPGPAPRGRADARNGFAHPRRGAPQRRSAPPLGRLVPGRRDDADGPLRRRAVPPRLRPRRDPLGRADVRRDRGREEDLRDRHARPRASREGHRPRPRDPRARPRSSRGDRDREVPPRHARARHRHRDRLGSEDPQQRGRPVRLLEPARGHGHRPAAGRPRPDRRREERPRLRLRPGLPRRQGRHHLHREPRHRSASRFRHDLLAPGQARRRAPGEQRRLRVDAPVLPAGRDRRTRRGGRR